MNEEKRLNVFLRRATAMHGNKFDYSKSIFTNQKTSIKIVCPVHGEFFQTPDKHVAKGSKGCPMCWRSLQSEKSKTTMERRIASGYIARPRISKEQFLEKANKKFNNKFQYNLTDYEGITMGNIKITCPTHGEHISTGKLHIISATGCPKCGREKATNSMTKNYDFIIEQLKIKHGHFYEYPEYNKENYRNKRSKIDIICLEHGKFTKSAQKHLSGQGCWECKVNQLIDDNILIGGYSEDLFQKRPELKSIPTFLYYLKTEDNKYYKIGISRICRFQNRLRGIKCKAKRYNENIELKEIKIKQSTLYECFLIEQKILNENKDCRIYRRWSTELFNKDIYEKIKHYLE